MKSRTRSRNLLLVCASLFVGFSAAHLIDEFLHGAPAEFHLSEPATEILSLIFVGALTGLVVLAARGSRSSHLGLAVIGWLIAAADLVKHVPEMAQAGTWRSGLVSEFLAVGLTLSAALTGALAFGRWRQVEETTTSDGGQHDV